MARTTGLGRLTGVPQDDMAAATIKALKEALLLAPEGPNRTAKVADLGLALQACDARRVYRGQAGAVMKASAGLCHCAADRASDGLWQPTSAFWRGHASAQLRAWKALGAVGHPGLLASAREAWDRVDAAGVEDLAERAEVELLTGDAAAAAVRERRGRAPRRAPGNILHVSLLDARRGTAFFSAG